MIFNLYTNNDNDEDGNGNSRTSYLFKKEILKERTHESSQKGTEVGRIKGIKEISIPPIIGVLSELVREGMSQIGPECDYESEEEEEDRRRKKRKMSDRQIGRAKS